MSTKIANCEASLHTSFLAHGKDGKLSCRIIDSGIAQGKTVRAIVSDLLLYLAGSEHAPRIDGGPVPIVSATQKNSAAA